MNPKFNTIVFDLGGVLIDWNPDYVFRTVFSSDEEMQWFYKNVCTPLWNEEQDAGRSLADGTELLVKQFPEHEKNIRMFYDRWEEMLGGPINDTVEIFRKIKTNHLLKTYALTNWSAETFPVALGKYDFLHWFNGRLVSGEEKTRKPFPDIYELLVNRFNINPETSVYIDDNPRNLAPAAHLGFATIHFQTPELLEAALMELGV
jgi:2-haloacid dehalogenase